MVWISMSTPEDVLAAILEALGELGVQAKKGGWQAKSKSGFRGVESHYVHVSF